MTFSEKRVTRYCLAEVKALLSEESPGMMSRGKGKMLRKI